MIANRSACALGLGLAMVAFGCTAASPTAPMVSSESTGVQASAAAQFGPGIPIRLGIVDGIVKGTGKYVLYIDDGSIVSIKKDTRVFVDGLPASWTDIAPGFVLHAEGVYVVRSKVLEADLIQSASGK